MSQNDVLGLDVGCGGAILFPALAAKLCQWKMLGSETESSDVELARENVDKNQLNESLQIIFNEDKASPLISAVQKATGLTTKSFLNFGTFNILTTSIFTTQINHTILMPGSSNIERTFPRGILRTIIL